MSVIIPNYNHARFLGKRVNTVLGQTFQDFEVILLDDCSTDDSRLILNQYAGDPRIRIEFNETNSGSPFKQWNKGVRLAQGEYVWIAESDDFADISLLEKLVSILDANANAAFAYCRSWRVSVDDEVKGFADPWLGEQEQDRWASDHSLGVECYNDFLRCNIVLNASAVLLKKTVYTQVGGADENLFLCGDWKLWAAMGMIGVPIYLSAPLNYFRFHPAAIRSLSEKNGVHLRESRLVQWWILDHVTRPESLMTGAHSKDVLVNRCIENAYMNYPMFPDISRLALKRAQELGGATPVFNTWKGELLKRMFGWKATRRAQLLYHRCVTSGRSATSN